MTTSTIKPAGSEDVPPVGKGVVRGDLGDMAMDADVGVAAAAAANLTKRDSEEDTWASKGYNYINPFVHRIEIDSHIEVAKVSVSHIPPPPPPHSHSFMQIQPMCDLWRERESGRVLSLGAFLSLLRIALGMNMPLQFLSASCSFSHGLLLFLLLLLSSTASSSFFIWRCRRLCLRQRFANGSENRMIFLFTLLLLRPTMVVVVVAAAAKQNTKYSEKKRRFFWHVCHCCPLSSHSPSQSVSCSALFPLLSHPPCTMGV